MSRADVADDLPVDEIPVDRLAAKFGWEPGDVVVEGPAGKPGKPDKPAGKSAPFRFVSLPDRPGKPADD